MATIADLLAAGRTYSFEFFPPKNDAEHTRLVESLMELQPLRPSFVSVTYRGGRSSRQRTHDLVVGMLRTTTLAPMAHLICVAHTRLELAEILVEFRKAGVQNLMALGGDPPTDPDAGFARRSGKPGSIYGYKAHVGVDEGSGLIRSVITTAANVNDTVPADALIQGDEKAVWADAAYHTHERERRLKARGVKARLMRRPNKHHPKLPPRMARYNQLIGRRRAAVETTFATLKRRMGLTAIRYIGLVKASAQVTLAAMAFNLRRWAVLAPA